MKQSAFPPGWKHRIGNPGLNDTKSAFADSPAWARGATRAHRTRAGLHRDVRRRPPDWPHAAAMPGEQSAQADFVLL